MDRKERSHYLKGNVLDAGLNSARSNFKIVYVRKCSHGYRARDRTAADVKRLQVLNVSSIFTVPHGVIWVAGWFP